MAETLWKTAFEQMRDGLALTEGEALLVRQANPAFWNILGVEPANRKEFMLLTRLGNDPSMLRWVHSVLAGQPLVTDLRQMQADGSHRHLEITAHPTQNNNQVFIELHDVTPLEDLREELQQVLQKTGAEPVRPSQARQEESRKGILRSFYAITATQSLALPNKFRELLRLGMDMLKLDLGLLVQLGKDKYIVLEAVSQDDRRERFVELDPNQTYCTEVVTTGVLVCFENASVTNRRLTQAYTASGMEAFVGAPVRMNNEVIGVLSFAGSQPRLAPFSQDDEEFVSLLAQWIGSEMERQQQVRQLQSNAEEIRQNNLLLAEARDQALESGRLKSEFLTTISHEIRTPMNGVIGMSNLLLQSSLNAEQQEYLGFIRSSAESLLKLFTELLDYSQLETGRARLETVTFEPAGLQALVADLYRGRADARNLRLAVYVAPEIPRKVRGDATRIEQVLKHLVDNAIKFTQSGSVSMHLTVARKEGATTWLEYRVTDTGIGISKAAQNRLFQPFSQVEGGTARKFGGMGLGLAICRRQAELLGGEINVQSVEGKGASFWLKIPLVDLEAEGVKATPVESGELSRLHALIASDRLERLTVVSEFLQGWGMKVHEMTYGEALTAMEQALNFECHLALMDAPSEGNLHLVATRRLRLKAGLADLPIGLVVDTEQLADGLSSKDGSFQMTLELPVKQTDLLDLAAKATQRLNRLSVTMDQAAPATKSVPAFTTDVSAEGEVRPMTGQGSLLLAEEDPAVLRILSGQLEDLGYQVKAVSNGHQVLEALLAEPERYDLALISLKLPGIDGINTVRLARKTEITRKTRTPLVGLLRADQMADKLVFMDAGLDDVLLLPFDAKKQAAVLEKLAIPRLGTRSIKGEPLQEGQPALDASYMQSLWHLEQVSGPGLVIELFQTYLQNSPGLITQMRQSLSNPETPEFKRAVHSLKGTSGNLGAHGLAKICADLELAVELKDSARLQKLFHRFESEYSRVRTAMMKEIQA